MQKASSRQYRLNLRLDLAERTSLLRAAAIAKQSPGTFGRDALLRAAVQVLGGPQRSSESLS